VDKDFASAKLAEILGADFLIILTAVEKVALRYGKPDQVWLSEMTAADAERYIKEGHFAPGSMLPKVEAALSFVKSKPGRKALITMLSKAREGLAGKTGTVIS
jgi:carbamate kinase